MSRLLISVLLVCLATTSLDAGSADHSIELDSSVFTSFDAEYEQLGQSLFLSVTVNPESRLMHARFGQGQPDDDSDRIGHFLPSLEFAYRQIGDMTIVRDRDDLSEAVLTRFGPEIEPAAAKQALDGMVFDGTWAYWLLAALPLAEGYTVALPLIGPEFPQRDGITMRETEFEVLGRQSLRTTEQGEFNVWLVRTCGSSSNCLENYVARKPPYLLKQVHVSESGERNVVVAWRGLINADRS